MVNINIKTIRYIIFILSFIVINSEEYKRILNYEYESGIITTINEKNNGQFEIDIVEFEDLSLPAFGLAFVNDINDQNNLTIIFDEIFKNSNKQEIDVKSNELTEKQNENILKVLDKCHVVYQLRYEVINNLDNNKTYKQRGYTYEYDNGHKFTIAMGEKPTGGYSISIRKTKIKKLAIIIYVSEKEPGLGEIVTEALTYPIAQIKLNAYASNIQIVNYDTNEVYPRLKNF